MGNQLCTGEICFDNRSKDIDVDLYIIIDKYDLNSTIKLKTIPAGSLFNYDTSSVQNTVLNFFIIKSDTKLSDYKFNFAEPSNQMYVRSNTINTYTSLTDIHVLKYISK